MTVDGDHFSPQGFGVGLAATVGVGLAAAALQAGNNVAQVVAEHREADAWDRINDTVAGLLEHNADMRRQLTDYAAAMQTIAAEYQKLLDLAMKQAGMLKKLRDGGVVID
jgi:short-subunit dehydrogenase involved in D-alanine esterification of teichoic acids